LVPLKFWNLDSNEYLTTESDDASIAATCAGMTYPTFEYVVRDVDFSGFSLVGSGSAAEATAIVMMYPTLSAQEGSDLESLVLDCENEFLEICNEARPDLSVEVFAIAERSIDDELGRSIGGDIPLVAVAYILMMVFASFTLGKPLNKLEGRAAVALADVLVILLASGAGYGFSSAIGTPLMSLIQVLPFILIAIGIDSAYVIAGAFDETSRSRDVYERIEEAVRFAGVWLSVTVTTGIDFVAFILAITSVLQAVQWFGIYAAFAILFIYFAQIPVFLALLVLDEQRRQKKANRADCMCCVRVKKYDIQNEDITKISLPGDDKFQIFFKGLLWSFPGSSNRQGCGVYHLRDSDCPSQTGKQAL